MDIIYLLATVRGPIIVLINEIFRKEEDIYGGFPKWGPNKPLAFLLKMISTWGVFGVPPFKETTIRWICLVGLKNEKSDGRGESPKSPKTKKQTLKPLKNIP